MDFYEVIRQTATLLQQQGRLTYRTLKRQFNLDDEALEDLKEQLLFAHPVVDEAGRGLAWTGEPAASESEMRRKADEYAGRQFHALLPYVMARLQRDKRVTYRTLKHAFGLDDALLHEIRKELTFRQLARDEQGEGLVWLSSVAAQERTTALQEAMPPISPSPTETPSNGPAEAPEHVSSGTPSIEPARTAAEAERRQLTVMFCNLADSTKLSQQLDPEDLREVVRAYQAIAAEIVHQYTGHMAQYLGDGLLIYFGWPQAHEDDAQRALHAGLEIVDAITTTLNPRLTQEKDVTLTVRLGVHTGPVVVGEMGGGGRHENLATGETVNIAARLEGLAAPNTVLISHATARLVQDAFHLEDLGSYELKGVAEPMPVSRVLGLLDTYEEEARTAAAPFLVGRDEEMGLLMRRWEQSKEGLGQVVLISGEAGIGKSTLVATVRHHVVQAEYTRLTFRCSPFHTSSALYPVIDYVQRVLQFQPGDTHETRLDKLERVLQEYSRPLEEVVPLYAALLSVSVPEGHYPALNVSPQQQRQQTQDALVGWLLEEAERQPTLAIWEDLHWADPSTLEMLGLVLEQTPTVPMLHVLTFRPEFEVPWPTRSHMTPITLNRLEHPQVEALITHQAASKALPDEVVQHIVVKTDGVPLYVEELTKMLLESDLLREETEQYVLTGPLLSVAIPDTLQDSLMARLDQLNTAKEVAQLGAVLGREFTYEILQLISPQDEETLLTGLAQLVNAELLYQRGRPPRSRYIFKHALIQDAAYASLLRSTRQQVHQQVAQRLETHFPEAVETQPELVAHHYTEAGCSEQAMVYWHRAGQHAAQRSAHHEAISHLRIGIQVLAQVPETPKRTQQELMVHVALGHSLIAVQGFAAPEVEQVYTRARELCQHVGNTLQLFQVLRGLALFYLYRGQLQASQELAEQFLSRAERQADMTPRMMGHHLLALALFHRGDFKDAARHWEQAFTTYNPQAHRDLADIYGIVLGVGVGSYAALTLWMLGYPERALKRGQEVLTLAQEQAHPYSLAHAQIWLAWLHQLRQEAQMAYDQAEGGSTLAMEQGFALLVARALVRQGWALTMQGQWAAGMAKLREGMEMDVATGAVNLRSYFLALLAQADSEAGQPAEGLHLLVEAQEEVSRTGVCFYQAELCRLQGELLLTLSADHHDEARSCFAQALDIARQQHAKSWELRAATSLARLWQSQSKRQEAHELLSPVCEWFTEGFDTADLQEARALLHELEG